MTTVAHFSASVPSVAAARRFAASTLADYPAPLKAQVVLMVSELATNAVQHAHSGFTVTIEEDAGSIRVTVRDAGGGHPQVRAPGPTELRGRGLMIVEAIAEDWGVDERSDAKAVWFAVPA